MNTNLRRFALAAAGAISALAFSSCAYDPYYSSTSVGGSYSSGYGDGYGYGGSSFSTSVLVSTGDSRWGYDPTCYSYYDYNRRAYYDPYLNGYYPVGYRPPVVYGVPHPYGWRPGSGYCPPPRNFRNVTVVNYRNRESAYRNSSYGWAKQVRQQSPSSGRVTGSRPSYNNSGNNRPDNNYRPGNNNNYGRPNTGSRPSQGGSFNRPETNFRPSQGNAYTRPTTNARPPSGFNNSSPSRPMTGQRPPQNSGNRNQLNNSGLPSRYNTPVRISEGPARQGGNFQPRVEGNRQGGNVQQRAEGNRQRAPQESRREAGGGERKAEGRNSGRESSYR